MSERYDFVEAATLLAKTRLELDSQWLRAERLASLAELLKGLADEAKALGYGAEFKENATTIIRANTVVFASLDHTAVAILVGMQSATLRGQAEPAPLEFDPIAGIFVGKTDDAFRSPVPGQPKGRRSAAAVVAEMVDVRIRALAGLPKR